MPDLGGALREFLDGGHPGSVPGWPPDRAQVSRAMDLVEGQFPTRRAAARAAGVGVETWRRWRLGVQHPSARKRLGFVSLVQLAGGWAKWRRGEWYIVATVRVSNDERKDRKLQVGRAVTPSTRARILEAARAGAWGTAVGLLWYAIKFEYKIGEDVEFPADDVQFHWEEERAR